MNIFRQKVSNILFKQLTQSQPYLFCSYIHLQDHEQKINPKDSRLSLSYMNPKKIVENSLKNEKFIAKIRRVSREHIQRRLFQQYKNKILEGKIDEQNVIEPDTLWGSEQKPVHYYQALSATQVTTLTHSIVKDIEEYRQSAVKKYFQQLKKINNVNQAKDVNDLAEIAANYRLNGVQDRQKYYQIEHLIGKKFHQLTTKSLIYLKYAFLTAPKKCTPQFNKIINNLLLQSIRQLPLNDLIHLMYFNRFDRFKYHLDNLQIPVIEQISKHFKSMNSEQKIDFLFLYVDSRSPTIQNQAKDRNHNQIRNKTQQLLYFINLDSDLSQLSELSVLKLAYFLVRAKTFTTDLFTDGICDYISRNIEQISKQNLILFFIYLSKIQSNKSISNLDLMKQLKQKVVNSWGQYSDINKVRALDAMYTLNLYDQATHQLYSSIPIQADSSLLGHICRIQMMNSSGREWEVIHRLVDLDVLPLGHFQDYKRFYNYVRWTAPDWDLTPLENKLTNSQLFFDSLRFNSLCLQKRYYRQLKQFQQFSSLKCLPKPFKLGQAIHNVQFGEFLLPQYMISLDVITDVERIRGTKDLKGSYQIKIKSLESLGWRHLYVFEEDVQKLNPKQFFDYIYSVCEPHFQEQLQVVKAQEEVLSDRLEDVRVGFILSSLPGPQLQQLCDSERTGVIPVKKSPTEREQNIYEARIQKMKI